MQGFISAFGMIFLAEMGDKTQLLMVGMASRYRIRQILPGVGLAILLLNTLAVGLGRLTGDLLPREIIGFAAAAAFLAFAYTSIGEREGEEEQESGGEKERRGGLWMIMTAFFLAELGDKTQLTAMMLAADRGREEALWLFLGASLGLYGADMLGFLIGYFLGKEIPADWFSAGAFLLFSVFGFLRLHSSLYTETTAGTVEGLLSGCRGGRYYAIGVVFFTAVIYLALCFWHWKRKKLKPSAAPSERP